MEPLLYMYKSIYVYRYVHIHAPEMQRNINDSHTCITYEKCVCLEEYMQGFKGLGTSEKPKSHVLLP